MPTQRAESAAVLPNRPSNQAKGRTHHEGSAQRERFESFERLAAWLIVRMRLRNRDRPLLGTAGDPGHR